jgi:hypothetical protein
MCQQNTQLWRYDMRGGRRFVPNLKLNPKKDSSSGKESSTEREVQEVSSRSIQALDPTDDSFSLQETPTTLETSPPLPSPQIELPSNKIIPPELVPTPSPVEEPRIVHKPLTRPAPTLVSLPTSTYINLPTPFPVLGRTSQKKSNALSAVSCSLPRLPLSSESKGSELYFHDG